ncbi:MAG: hypothetical protein ACREHF_02785 [Rhizomicrobium sp.]
MNEPSTQKLKTIEAVARHFGARCGDDPRDGHLLNGGKRIAVEVATLSDRVVGPGAATKPRLRFDKVARGLVARRKAGLGELVPDGMTVVFTITARIRLASQTAAAMEERIGTCLARRTAAKDFVDTIHENRIRVRFVKSGARRAAKVVGFVHNPDPSAGLLLDMTASLLRHIGAAAEKPARSGSKRERWLVIVSPNGSRLFGTYRQVYAELSLQTGFRKILVMFQDGKVETLSG